MIASGAMFSWRKRYTAILSFLRIWFYSSFLMTTGLPISNGLEVEQQPVKACKKRSCLASPKGSANLFMLHRRVTFPTLSEVKMRSYPFWSTKRLSNTKISVSSPMTSDGLDKTNDSKYVQFILDGGSLLHCALEHLRGVVLHLTLFFRLIKTLLTSTIKSVSSSVGTSQGYQ